MSELRTYRVLPLLVGLSLLIGVAAPTVQAACAMMADRAQETSMPCHGHEVPMQHIVKADMPCDGSPSARSHLCCKVDVATLSCATLLSNTTSRTFDLALVAVLPDGALIPSVARAALPEKKPPASSFTTTPLRQAFLSTFLI